MSFEISTSVYKSAGKHATLGFNTGIFSFFDLVFDSCRGGDGLNAQGEKMGV